ncbi:conserved membrane hypothetical protein [Thiomonas sp. X19]|uniref:hypothetical protein n=1 Tax=Thiomonas sp. X19 TaxID=1050370 RepID=UPI000B69BDF9|nr:hypothetical protein [Thiomonas sp. X19]SCC95102.1 conserved membrane hypothetical protein [Thiomonas sp. X19]
MLDKMDKIRVAHFRIRATLFCMIFGALLASAGYLAHEQLLAAAVSFTLGSALNALGVGHWFIQHTHGALAVAALYYTSMQPGGFGWAKTLEAAAAGGFLGLLIPASLFSIKKQGVENA